MQRLRRARAWPCHAANYSLYSWQKGEARCFQITSLPRERQLSSALWHSSPLSAPAYQARNILKTHRLASTLSVSANAKVEPSFSQAPRSTQPPGLTMAQILSHYSQCYWELSKAKLSMLVATTAGAGFVLGSGAAIDYYSFSWTCTGTFLVAAAANTFNQILEVQNDSKMKRTRGRPLPTGRITTQHAMAWAVMTGMGGVASLASQANLIAAGLGAINLVLYTLVYTPLKQVHPINTWVGAVVGAVPPLLGWAAAAGEVNVGAWLLASALYFWQIPHFTAIAYICRDDYAAGGFRMLSMVDKSGKKTALVALRNCAYLLPLGFLAYEGGLTSHWFGWETAVLSGGMGALAALFYYKPTKQRARILFRASLVYLPVLLLAVLLHRLPNEHHTAESSKARLASSESGIWNLREGAVPTQASNSYFKQPLPPVAFFSVAPFPFLPVPVSEW